MPSKSGAQHNLMAMVAHDPSASKRTGIPKGVAAEFVHADRGKRFAKVRGMGQHNTGGAKRTHTTNMPGHATAGAYAMGPRRAR